ncbi:fluoride efflux transporter FluC [Halobellus rufus]|uniref:fluoride efflux transporter FluC n=1 Tax=Halobellus rufus TaxID=1448860 RepID=UPI000678C5CD|nr:CrcB family protein [Halobellus rufus]
MADRLLPALVALGGFLGATARYLVGTLAVGPSGTLLVNVAGSFALAAAVGNVRSTRARTFLMTGLLSSFTTYSTFAMETASLGLPLGLANVAATYALGFAAASLGLFAGRRWA